MKEIINKKGLVMLVDDEDYEKMIQFKWYMRKGDANRYYAITIMLIDDKKRWVYAHRFIMNVHNTKKEIDHKNRNGLDNRKENLRIASRSDNVKNIEKHRGTSKYWGVHKSPSHKWIAKININGKQKHLGSFNNEMDAAICYNQAAISTGNEFYNINRF